MTQQLKQREKTAKIQFEKLSTGWCTSQCCCSACGAAVFTMPSCIGAVGSGDGAGRGVAVVGREPHSPRASHYATHLMHALSWHWHPVRSMEGSSAAHGPAFLQR